MTNYSESSALQLHHTRHSSKICPISIYLSAEITETFKTGDVAL